MQTTTREINNRSGDKFFIRSIMANFTDSTFINSSSMLTNSTTKDDAANVSLRVSYIITIIINSITCPFTVLLNVLVTMAVKRRPRLQTNANILLACLAATDAFTGLTSQPSFIAWKISELLGAVFSSSRFGSFGHYRFIRLLSICSCFHLMLVTCERLIAIKFTMYYEEIVSKRKIKIAVVSCWIVSISYEMLKVAFRPVKFKLAIKISDLLLAVVLMFCIVFVASSYVILYLETRRHQKVIKTQQIPQGEMERFAKENKALKTTVYVVGALVLCFAPMGLTFVSKILKIPEVSVSTPWVRTFAMSNSLLNPLIYCSRQKEMRKFVFRKRTQVVQPAR